MNWFYASFFLSSFALSLLLTRLAKNGAKQFGFLDHPGTRKIHKKPVPLLGGVAILNTFLIVIWGGLAAFALHKEIFPAGFLPEEVTRHLAGALRQIPKLLAVSLGAIAIASVGLYDDKFHIQPKTKFLWQWGIALAVVFLGGIRLHFFLNEPLVTGLLSAFWLVVLMNAFNLLDNMDGLSAGVAFIACLLFAAIAVVDQQYFLAAALLVLSGTLGGFLLFNFHPAKIFMGDCGSQSVGFLIGCFTLLETFYSPVYPTHFPVLMPLLILAVPLYDTASVIVLRTLKRESLFKADRQHFSHRLNALGMSIRGTVLFIYLVTLSLGLTAPLLPRLSARGAGLVFLQALCTIAVIAILERYGKKKLERRRR